jgi:hypothetical protein
MTRVEEERVAARPPELSDPSVTSVRVLYSDLHGIARGKDVPIGEFDRAADHGLAFCSAIMGTDLRHTPVVGPEIGYPDLRAVPDLSTLKAVPWEPGLLACLADLHPVTPGSAPPPDPRGALKRAIAAYEELGLEPIVGPELEFFLCVRDENGVRRYVDNLSMVYTVGPQADPKGVVRQIAEAPELGWTTIESDDPELVPAGPWLEWHFDRFTVPDGATAIARNDHSTQAFVHGPHLGTQFHPESTIEVVAGWARADNERLQSLGITDGESRLDVSDEKKREAREAAFRLFDAFLAGRQR